ncbi:MAG: hypothetical protein QM710_03435 [Flavobacterium sp.]
MNNFKLDNEPKISTGFTIPDGYFETFSEKMLEQVPRQKPKVVPFFNYRKAWYYAAAAMIILMVSFPLYMRYSANQQEIDSTTLENYLAYNSNISEDQIVDLLEQEDLDKMKMELNVDDKAIEEALKSNSNLEEYLLD